MLRVGLTGGVASGKSALARVLAARGAAVLDADMLVAEMYRPGAAGARAVEALFGRSLLAADGGVDRPSLGSLVLADAAARRRLEAVIHPLVRAGIAGWLGGLLRDRRPPEVAVVEAALLVETGYRSEYDRLVVVIADEEVRLARALARGWSETRFRSVAAAQTSDAAREAAADYVVHNDGDLAALERSASRLWPLLIEDASAVAAGPLAPRGVRL